MATITVGEMQARIGTTAVSDWVDVSQAMIDTFAQATGDRQFIHVDPTLAAATPFGGTIAHGFLILSLLPLLSSKVTDADVVEGTKMVINYGCNKVRFVTPVRSGSRVRGCFTLLDFAEREPGRYQQTLECIVAIEGGAKPAMVAEWISQIVL